MSKLSKTGILYLVGFLLAGSPAIAQQQPKPPTIERIEIRGNRRMKEDDVRYYIQSHAGDVYDEERLALDLRYLYKEGKAFENIQIMLTDGDTGKIVTFLLQEKPLVREIKYTGNKSFTESNILDHFKERKVGIVQDSVYEPAKVRAAERALRELMMQNGRPLGNVHTEVEDVPPNSVRLRFVMDEGPKVRIGDIRFVGNKIFSDDELKGALKLTKERGPIAIFKGYDKYYPDKLDYDIEENLKAYYQERGYLQVQVGDPLTRIFEGSRGYVPMLRKTREQFLVEIPIEAGDQYHLGELKVSNCGVMSCEKIAAMFGMTKGDVLNYKRVKNTIEAIKKGYGDLGFIDADLIPEQTPHPDTKTVDLSFDLEPGKQFTVHRIDFEGNTKTRDRVMRRELLIQEGWPFSSRALDLSVQKLNMLGYFDKIEEKDYQVTPDQRTSKVDVRIKVKEKSAQSIGLTGGVSGISGSFIGVNYQTNNLLGRGESLELSVTAGTRTTDFVLSFTEPYLLDTRWNLGVSLFNERNRFDTYSVFGITNVVTGQPTALFTQRTSGFTVTASRLLGRSWWRAGLSYTYQKIKVADISSGFETFALEQFTGFVPGGNATQALNGIIRSQITPSLTFNNTNAFYDPTKGHSITMSAAFSGSVLGGGFNEIHPSIEYRQFFPDKWISGGRNTFGFRLAGEYVAAFGGSTVPFFDRFFIGGETTIRGFDIRSVSPLVITSTKSLDANGNPVIDYKTGLAKVTNSIDPIGGDTMGLFNGEYRIRIAGPLSMALFYDVGISTVLDKSQLGVFGTSITNSLVESSNRVVRGSTGLEISFMVPMVNAPFRLIFAYNPQVYRESVKVGLVPINIAEPRHDIKFTIGRSF
jgi:outer membrane protein insertion porin family